MTVSRHLAQLKHAGLIEDENAARWYSTEAALKCAYWIFSSHGVGHQVHVLASRSCWLRPLSPQGQKPFSRFQMLCIMPNCPLKFGH